MTPAEAVVFLRKGAEFLGNAKAARSDGDWDSAGLLAIHSAISTADALLGFVKGYRSTASDHRALVQLLRASAPPEKREEWEKQADRVAAIIARKNLVEYEARNISEEECRLLCEQAERFHEWVRGNLPRS